MSLQSTFHHVPQESQASSVWRLINKLKRTEDKKDRRCIPWGPSSREDVSQHQGRLSLFYLQKKRLQLGKVSESGSSAWGDEQRTDFFLSTQCRAKWVRLVTQRLEVKSVTRWNHRMYSEGTHSDGFSYRATERVWAQTVKCFVSLE